MVDHQRIVAKTRLRIGLILGLRAAVVVLSAWLLAWGITVLVLRGAFAFSSLPLLWGLAGVPAALAVGTVVGMRRMPSVATVRAMLDHHWKCGGLLMSSAETDAQGWQIKPASSTGPAVHWDSKRHLGILLCCVTFLLAGFLVPARLLEGNGSGRLQVDAEVEKLAEKIEVLKAENILPPERAQSLEQALEQLQREASGNDPGKTWEAMDHLEQSIAKASAEAAENAARDAQKAANAQELAAALDQARNQMTPQNLSEAMNALAKDVMRAADENELLSAELSKELLEQLKNGSLSAEELAELAKTLGECKECGLETLKKLASARLIDPSLLEKLEGNCQIDPDALAELLVQCKGGDALGQCLAQGNRPGRGGISRGRGDAAMTWTDGSSKEDVAFKEQVLPPGAAASLKESRLQGLSVSDPTADKPAAPGTGGALDVSLAGRGAARTQVILPEHKKVIQRYFSREPAGAAKPSGNP